MEKTKKLVKAKAIRVLVTGGPTRAYFDRVRYLSNYSSGSTAFSVCEALLKKQVSVALVAGPTTQPWKQLKLSYFQKVETNEEMRASVLQQCSLFRPDVVVFTAAVLDFAPRTTRPGKVSSKKKEWIIKLVPAPKIIDEVNTQFPKIPRIGFKLEWEKPSEALLEKFAMKYLKKKKLQGLCLNFLPEVGDHKHVSYLFTEEGFSKKSFTKKETGIWVSNLVAKLRTKS